MALSHSAIQHYQGVTRRAYVKLYQVFKGLYKGFLGFREIGERNGRDMETSIKEGILLLIPQTLS